MDVVALERIVCDAEAPALARRREAVFPLANELLCPQRRQPAPHLQRHVTREQARERLTRSMRMSRARAALAARTRASSTPARAFVKAELELSCTPCHDLHCDMQV